MDRTFCAATCLPVKFILFYAGSTAALTRGFIDHFSNHARACYGLHIVHFLRREVPVPVPNHLDAVPAGLAATAPVHQKCGIDYLRQRRHQNLNIIVAANPHNDLTASARK